MSPTRACLTTLFLLLAIGSIAAAQEAETDAGTDDADEIDEIIVLAPRPGDRRRLPREFEDPVRARVLKDLYEMKMLEEEYEWRREAIDPSPSRIKLGYDPRDDYRRREEMDILAPGWQTVEPATIFRFEF